MKKILQWLSQEAQKSSQTEEERYLSQATSLQDLERRQKDISLGRAPFQFIHRLNAGIFQKENTL